MSDLSSYTHKWRATPTTIQHSEGNKVNKRNRQPVSCAPCRNRKLKCDRGHPCDACSKRSDEDSCVYGKTAGVVAPRRDEAKSNLKAQERLRHLEELVKQMIGPDKNVPTPQTPPTDQPEGSLSKDVNGINYTGSTHWATVLDQIQELQNTLSPAPDDDDSSHTGEDERTDSLFVAPTPLPLPMLLQRYLPTREECNRYMSTYFNCKYIYVPFLHKYQFKRQYEKFWTNQLETPPLWVSMLFSLLCIADGIRRAPLSLYQAKTDPSKARPPFLTASAQCLVLGNYAKTQTFVVEALALYCQCRYTVTLDPSHELGMIFAVLSRHAYSMGYHREPSLFGTQFTIFEAEMRRRGWHLFRQFDVMVSFQLGLPAILQPDSADIRLPSHLLDEDFDEDSTVLPPPRPDTEPSQMLYIITKARVMDTYSKVCQHTLTFPQQPFTFADIQKLDNAITQVIALIPPILHVRPMSESYADPPNLTMVRSNLMFLGEKARCILHRKYMVSGPNAESSRAICIGSSTRTIKHFLDFHAELQPGGQLFNDRWMLTSFTINDFLLALMVLCLAFSLGRKKFIADGGDPQKWLDQDHEARTLFELLDRAQPVCKEYGSRAREARHVAEAVGLMLTQLRPKNLTQDQEKNENGQLRSPYTRYPGAPKYNIGNALLADNDWSKNDMGMEAIDSRMPVDIMPLSIHNSSHISDTSASNAFSINDTQFVAQPQQTSAATDFTPDPSSFDTSNYGNGTGLQTWSNQSDPSPTSSWDLMDGPLNNILEGPEQIDWVQFDQFLWTYGVSSDRGGIGGEEEIL